MIALVFIGSKIFEEERLMSYKAHSSHLILRSFDDRYRFNIGIGKSGVKFNSATTHSVSKSLVVKNSIRIEKISYVSRQKLNSNRENIVRYSINLDVFSIAIEFLTTNDLDSAFQM